MLAEEFLGDLVVPFPVVVLRLLGAVVLCGAIGFERESRDHSAGLRTHMLVGLAAAAYALIGIQMIDVHAGSNGSVQTDPLRLIEALTAGVAFLAAGMIVLSRGRIRNLTTGAGMWLAAAVGLAAGCGYWAIAGLAALLGLAISALDRLWTVPRRDDTAAEPPSRSDGAAR